ncbi:MAG: hypothetical protein ACK5OX_08310 [Desertimonas sp.]
MSGTERPFDTHRPPRADRSRPHRRRTIDIDTLVVGAGPQALTVLARWARDRPASVNQVVVVDPAGGWMRAWHDQFERQRIEVLRSPGVHHPDPDEMAFVHRCVRRRAGTDAVGVEQATTAIGPLRRPTTVAFTRFCRDLVRGTGLSRRVVAGTVIDLDPANQPSRPCWTAELDDGTTVGARQVIWAGNPRRRVVPDGVELGATVRHSDQVDIDDAAPGCRIAVLGGGQTAGQLALEASRRGAHAVVIGRGAARVADLDVDAGWLMDDRLAPFRSIACPAQRRRVVEAARRGSMTSDLVATLERASIPRLTATDGLRARSKGDGAIVEIGEVVLDVDEVWVATGSVPDLRADPALSRRAADGASHADGWPILDGRLRWLDGLSVVGALAALTLGPAAGNLGGARAAAETLAGQRPRAM